MEIITRAEAQAHKPPLKHYFTGKPCKHGHVCERATCDRRCRECGKANNRAYREAHREELRAKVRARYEASREEKNARERAERVELRALRQAIEKLKSTPLNLGDLL